MATSASAPVEDLLFDLFQVGELPLDEHVVVDHAVHDGVQALLRLEGPAGRG